MAAFFKNLSRFLSSSKHEPAIHLAAFGKHPAWNDHIDDLGLDTEPLVSAKRVIYTQGLGQNIDSGAWDRLDPAPAGAAGAPQGRLAGFHHEFLWHMPPHLLAGALWSSSDGKGRDKYPMVLAAQLTGLPDAFAASVVLPFLEKVHQQCAAAPSAEEVRRIVATQREQLRARVNEAAAPEPLAPAQLVAVATHADMLARQVGFQRIVYQFAQGMSAYRPEGASAANSRMIPRSEQVRLPSCGMAPREALLFWLRFALTFLDPMTPILLIAPSANATANGAAAANGPGANPPSPAYWVDLIAGDPASTNLFCLKAGTGSLPFTSEIPYTLNRLFMHAVDGYIRDCASAPPGSPLPSWPDLAG